MESSSDVYMAALIHCISVPYHWYWHKGAG